MLSQKVALVTGASGGLGKSIALELGRQRANVVVHYGTNKQQAHALVAEIEKNDSQAIALQGNIQDHESMSKLFKEIVEKFGKLDILVNNAGIVRDAPLARMKLEDFDDTIAVNLRGTFICLKEASRLMLRNKYGRVITISSVVGLTGNIGQGAYAASKAGMIALTKTFAREFGRWDITANVVAPGLIDGGMSERLKPELKEKIVTLIPKARMGNSQEIAHLVTFLASKESSYITGQVYNIDGGMVM